MYDVILARSNHPAGWGIGGSYRKVYDQQYDIWVESDPKVWDVGGAHGYVILAVRCTSWNEVTAVRDGARSRFFWKGRKQDGWYDGFFDVIYTVPVADDAGPTILGSSYSVIQVNEYRSLGDNRAFALITAKEFLDNVGF